MFQKIVEGAPIFLKVEFVNELGDALQNVAAVSWKVVNEAGLVVMAGENVIAPGDTSITVEVDGHQNVPVGPLSVSSYELEYSIACDDGPVKGYMVYQVERLGAFKPWSNSFATYLQMLSLMREMPDLPGFSAASKDERIGALMFAFDAICAMPFNCMALPEKWRFIDGQPITSTSQITDEIAADCPPAMVKDFMVAQLMEADELLGGDDISKLRERGVQSYSVGEVKQFFQGRAPVSMGMSKRALRRIGKYMNFTRSISRA